MRFLKDLIFPVAFMPHGSCYLWTRGLIGPHVVSDSLIAFSCLPIPITPVQQFREILSSLAVSWLHVSQPSRRQAMTNRLEKSI